MQKFKNSARSAKKGNWTEQEDRILMDWIKSHGPNKWTECSKNIKGRCGKQCRERWVNILNPGVKKGNWTEEEQVLIFQNLKNYFTSWSLMAKELDGRTENSIKNYFYSSIRRLKSNNIIHYLSAIYGQPEVKLMDNLQINSEDPTEKNYTECLRQKLPLIMQNLEKIKEEISKLNCLSKLICFFMMDMEQVEDLIKRSVGLNLWVSTFDESEKDFLRFLIEIVLELNSNGRYGENKTKKKSGRNSRKGKNVIYYFYLRIS